MDIQYAQKQQYFIFGKIDSLRFKKRVFKGKGNQRSKTMLSYFLIILFLLINTSIQVVFKIIALGPGGSNYLSLLFEPLFYLCGILFAVQALLWIGVLKRMPLSKAYPFTSLAVITMIISGYLFFGEPISLGNVLGAAIIITGVVIITGDKTRI